jgi:hypothetical protein
MNPLFVFFIADQMIKLNEEEDPYDEDFDDEEWFEDEEW